MDGRELQRGGQLAQETTQISSLLTKIDDVFINTFFMIDLYTPAQADRMVIYLLKILCFVIFISLI